jgi:hypothetical protein
MMVCLKESTASRAGRTTSIGQEVQDGRCGADIADDLEDGILAEGGKV